MKFKLGLAVALGLLVGLLAGGYFGFRTAQRFVDIVMTSQVETRFVDKVLLLKLIDDGNIEAARTNLLAAVQSDTILVSSISSTATPKSPADDAHIRLVRFARMSGELKSVRDDDSELGREATVARIRLPTSGK